MPELTETELKKRLSTGEVGSLYLLMGEEKYLVKRAARRLIRKAAGEGFQEFNCQEMEGGVPIDALADAVEVLPLFAQRKCVAVSDLNIEERTADELKKLYELLDDLPASTTLVLWYPTLDFDGKKSAKWKKLVQACMEKGAVLSFDRRTAPELIKMLLREAEKAGCTLSRRDAERILDYAGQDVTRLLGEMEKLCAFALGSAREGKVPEITAQSIEDLVPKSTETTAFLMANALTSGNYERAYGLLDALFYQNEEPIKILGALSASYVDMYRTRTAVESGKPAQGAAEYADYKRKEFRLRNAERSARSVPTEALRDNLYLLLEADLALKGSRMDGRTVLEELIAKLLLVSDRYRRGV